MESQYLAQGPCSQSNLKNFDPLIVISWLSHLGPRLLHLQAASGRPLPISAVSHHFPAEVSEHTVSDPDPHPDSGCPSGPGECTFPSGWVPGLMGAGEWRQITFQGDKDVPNLGCWYLCAFISLVKITDLDAWKAHSWWFVSFPWARRLDEAIEEGLASWVTSYRVGFTQCFRPAGTRTAVRCQDCRAAGGRTCADTNWLQVERHVTSPRPPLCTFHMLHTCPGRLAFPATCRHTSHPNAAWTLSSASLSGAWGGASSPPLHSHVLRLKEPRLWQTPTFWEKRAPVARRHVACS